MRRREFVGFFGGVLASPIAARAQQPAKVARVGYLSFGTAAATATRIEALRAGLNSLGYVEGKNIAIEFRWAKNADELREFADQLVAENVDIIFAISSTETGAARQATKVIPIVFATHADPVGTGHVASLARPGGNITGLSVLLSELTAKAFEILKEVVPKAKRFGVLLSPTAPSHVPTMRAAEAAAEKLGVTLHTALVRAVEEYEEAFAEIDRADVQAVFVHAAALTVRSRPELLAQLALKYRLPSMFGARDNVAAGGLMSYAPDFFDLHRRAATYIDKILKGSKPADLPVEQASQYQLIINLKAVKALGITVPPTLLARADEVIE
jgi:putative tryptophan/tyrosine transport system substrate-binding protein